jgi:hypothetical protein
MTTLGTLGAVATLVAGTLFTSTPDASPKIIIFYVVGSVSDLGCLSRIRIFFIPDPGSRVKKIPDPGSASASKNLSIFYPKNCF